MNLTYEIVQRQPVARFYYKGSHSHPVRRTVVLTTETNNDTIIGYELRAGNTVRTIEDAPVKSYTRSEIPRYGDFWRGRRTGEPAERSTLKRYSMKHLNENGA